MTEEIKCPHCEADWDDGDLDYWIDNNQIWNWTCFNCQHEWTTNRR